MRVKPGCIILQSEGERLSNETVPTVLRHMGGIESV